MNEVQHIHSISAERLQELNELLAAELPLIQKIQDEMAQIVVGQKHMVSRLIIALLADGHILLEGVPGLAKTLAINTLSQIINGQSHRIQFTPDLLPADITGTIIYSPKTEAFSIKKGPLFSNFILADEINRAPAKVQSALLEAMQEKQVTIGEKTYPLPIPFLVMATQNPIDQDGTYPLPEAQVDRFMLKVVLDYPTVAEERRILFQELTHHSLKKVSKICSTEDIIRLRDLCTAIHLDEKIGNYIVDIVYATRKPQQYMMGHLAPMIESGASPRATINLAKAAKANAFLNGRAFVIPDDVKAVAMDILRHRVQVSFEGEAEDFTSETIVQHILAKIDVP